MNNFKNSFVVGGAIIIFFILIGLLSVNLYIRIQEHNLKVLSELVLRCKDLSGDQAEKCAQAFKRLYIPKYQPLN